MAISRIRVWVAFDILTAAAQNAEFNNIIDYINDVLDPADTALDARLDTAEADIVTLETEVQPIARGGTGEITAAAAFGALKQAATDAATGVVELATTAEINTGTDATRVMTPDAFAGSTPGTRVIIVKVIDDATGLTVGDGKAKVVIPAELNGMDLVSVGAHVFTASSSGTPTIQIYNATQAADMLSTRITIDANEKDSSSAAAAAVIDGANDDVATGDELRIDVDVAGTSTTGLEVRLGFRLP